MKDCSIPNIGRYTFKSLGNNSATLNEGGNNFYLINQTLFKNSNFNKQCQKSG